MCYTSASCSERTGLRGKLLCRPFTSQCRQFRAKPVQVGKELSLIAQSLWVSQLPLVIKTPHALPMYRDDQGKGRKRPYEREADEAIRTKRPDPGGGLPGLGLGKGGKLGATGGTLLTQYILQNQVSDELR